MSRYADPFLNALADSHEILLRAELWYAGNYSNVWNNPTNYSGGASAGPSG